MTTLSSTDAATAGRGATPRRRATMRDVAALAGVGIKTVSRVVNGEPGVSGAMAQRVNEAARALNYRPDLHAGNLRRSERRSLSLGLVLASVDNPFSAAIHRAIEDVAGAQGVAVLAGSTDEEPDRERALVAALTARRVDGLIVSAITPDQGYLRWEQESGTPIVMVDRRAVGIDVDSVVVDNAAGAGRATRHLLEHGHRRIAYLGDLGSIDTARERHRGFVRALADAGIPASSAPAANDIHSEVEAEAAVHALLTGPEAPTALFTSQNLITIGAIRALRTLGLQHRVALVGFDDFQLADLLEPRVTVIAQDPARIGAIAAQRVFDRLASRDLPTETITVPTRLVARGSGEIRPA
ncbi:LacI family DNA-binding transcriptional regulator [Cellulomonas sp. S1-8]|uniref:LacI family DNA-binding transcriptional regulator n=1 Tax=Cellulomonas sp. S1-8 TaxID=2904790 RepID=UPI002AD333AD|nr:LacI family DNA-binding transcriptional regulator [Cellulomonas sp. S1-8]